MKINLAYIWKRFTVSLWKRGIDWNYYPTACKHGTCYIKTEQGWVLDDNIPIFKGEDRNYIEKFIYIDKEEL